MLIVSGSNRSSRRGVRELYETCGQPRTREYTAGTSRGAKAAVQKRSGRIHYRQIDAHG
jgi:hypothetical protein